MKTATVIILGSVMIVLITFLVFNATALDRRCFEKGGIPDGDVCKIELTSMQKSQEKTIPKLIDKDLTAESETKLWKSTDDWNSMRLVRNGDGLYCNSNETLSDQCYSLDEIVFGNGFKRTKHYGWQVYPGAGIKLPENSTLTPIYKPGYVGLQIDWDAIFDDKIFVNKCESNGGIWNYIYHDCEGIGESCQDVGGINVSMGVSIPCTGVCLDRGIYRLACVFEYEN